MGQKYSFQELMKNMMNMAKMDDLHSGTTILVNVRTWPTLSRRATSTNDLGMVRILWRIKKIPHGITQLRQHNSDGIVDQVHLSQGQVVGNHDHGKRDEHRDSERVEELVPMLKVDEREYITSQNNGNGLATATPPAMVTEFFISQKGIVLNSVRSFPPSRAGNEIKARGENLPEVFERTGNHVR